MVLFTFNKEAPISRISEKLKSLTNIKGVLEVDFNSVLLKDRAKGVTHVGHVVLDDMNALEVYQVHSEHLEFKDLIKPFLVEGPTVVDMLITK